MEFARERLTPSLFEEMMPLLHSHWKEIAHYQDILLEPDYDHYVRAQECDALRVFTVRDEADILHGYAVFYVRPNPHYARSVQAAQDILFLSKEIRGTREGMKFISWCDSKLADERVQAVYHHVKKKFNFGPALEKQGYELVDLVYAKRLDKQWKSLDPQTKYSQGVH
jgi:hypothetical protein